MIFNGRNNQQEEVFINLDNIFLIQIQRDNYKVVSNGAAIVNLDLREGERFIKEYKDYLGEINGTL
jgi:hypothetical protein